MQHIWWQEHKSGGTKCELTTLEAIVSLFAQRQARIAAEGRLR
jgi:hypothetical protein